MNAEVSFRERGKARWWWFAPLMMVIAYVLGLAPLNACVWKCDEFRASGIPEHCWLATLNAPMTAMSMTSQKTYRWIWTYQGCWGDLLGVQMKCLNISTWALN